jgi:paraquat-inducible protein B
MRKKVDAATLGAFVVGAVVLVVVAVVVWGSGRLFRETEKFVGYFQGSVEGLEVGAPVKVRGVAIGRVTRIQLRFRQRLTDIRVPVFVEVDLKRLREVGGIDPELIARGLRARLEPQSLLTGTLFVNVDQYPGTPLHFSELDPEHGYPEIPTVPSQFAQLSDSVTAVLAQLQRSDVPGMVKAIEGAAVGIERLATNGKVPEALGEATSTLRSYQTLAHHLDVGLQPLVADLRGVVVDARKALVGLDGAAGAAQRMVAPEAPLTTRLGDALDEVGRAAEALRELADYLQRNPNAILVGKAR